MNKMRKQYSNLLETRNELALLSDAKAEEDQDKFKYGYREEYQKKRPSIFRTEWGEVRQASRNASIKIQFHILPP